MAAALVEQRALYAWVRPLAARVPPLQRMLGWPGSSLACAHSQPLIFNRGSSIGISTSCSAQQRTAGEASTSDRGKEAFGGSGRVQQQHAGAKRQRLDDYCLSLHPEYSKNLIQSWIVQGKVLINDR